MTEKQARSAAKEIAESVEPNRKINDASSAVAVVVKKS